MKIRIFGAALLLFAMIGVSTLAEAAGPTLYFQVTGNVQNPTSFDIRKLQALPPVDQNVTYL
jgi:hypothetical protein